MLCLCKGVDHLVGSALGCIVKNMFSGGLFTSQFSNISCSYNHKEDPIMSMLPFFGVFDLLLVSPFGLRFWMTHKHDLASKHVVSF